MSDLHPEPEADARHPLPSGVLALAAQLPDPDTLRRHCQGLAALEAIATGEPEERYFSFDAAWAADEQLASMDDGSGNSWSITFTPAGVWLRGFDHESPMSPYGDRFDVDWAASVPGPLRPAALEPAFSDGDLPLLTLACWWLNADESGTGPRGRWVPVRLRERVPADLDDGGGWLAAELDTRPDTAAETYVDFAGEYYETNLDPVDVAHVLALRPLDEALVQRLNPTRSLSELAADLQRIGYPSS